MTSTSAIGSLSFVVSDGKPFEATFLNIWGETDDFVITADNRPDFEDLFHNRINLEIIPFLESEHTRAKSEEADLLGALQLAGDILENRRGLFPDRENHILIVDSGISTAGYLDLRNYDFQADSFSYQDIVDGLRLPQNLGGIKITFMNLGATGGSQYLSASDRDDILRPLWNELLSRTDAIFDSVRIMASSAGRPEIIYTESGELPFVTPVHFRARREVPLYRPAELEVDFYPNISELRDERNAIISLRNIATSIQRFLDENPEEHIYIVGSEAYVYGQLSDRSLSEGRANVVRDLLLNTFDLPKERVIPIGTGTTPFSWRKAPEIVNGEWNEINAQKNRIVVSITSNMEAVEELREAGFID